MTARTDRFAPALGLTVAAVLVTAVGVTAMSFADESSAPSSIALAVVSSGSPTATPARVLSKAAVTPAPGTPSATPASSRPASSAPQPSWSASPVPTPTTAAATAVAEPKLMTIPPSGPTSSDQDARAVFDAINRARLAQHLPALTWSSRLQLSAQRHNQAMAAGNTLAHQVGSEGSLGQRENQAGVRWTFAAENIGWTTTRSLSGALGIQASMLAESPPNDAHRRNILSPQAKAMGISVLIDARHGRLWLTEDFADVG